MGEFGNRAFLTHLTARSAKKRLNRRGFTAGSDAAEHSVDWEFKAMPMSWAHMTELSKVAKTVSLFEWMAKRSETVREAYQMLRGLDLHTATFKGAYRGKILENDTGDADSLSAYIR